MEENFMSEEEFENLGAGDTVFIRPDLSRITRAQFNVNEDMERRRGETVTVYCNGGNYIKLIEDNMDWYWSREMFMSQKDRILKEDDRKYKDFKKGDLVKIRSYEDLEKYYKKVNGVILTKRSFRDDMKKFCGKEAVIKEVRNNEVILRFRELKRDEYREYSFSEDMLEIVEEGYESKQKEKKGKKVMQTEEDIEKEMIEKVDRKKLTKILASAFRIKATELNGVDLMLENWAKQKKDLYILLGKQLRVSKEIEYEADEHAWREKREELIRKFPRNMVLIK